MAASQLRFPTFNDWKQCSQCGLWYPPNKLYSHPCWYECCDRCGRLVPAYRIGLRGQCQDCLDQGD